jgi:hypothetical protein
MATPRESASLRSHYFHSARCRSDAAPLVLLRHKCNHNLNLARVCVSPDSPINLYWAVGLGIDPNFDYANALLVCLRQATRDALTYIEIST